MAYMTKEGGGPYPNKAGEYCGNHRMDLINGKMINIEQHPEDLTWLATMRLGRPRPCKAGTTCEMTKKGYVGLYLKNDNPSLLPNGAIEIPTPPELMEPETLF